jgi:hypothetical protein
VPRNRAPADFGAPRTSLAEFGYRPHLHGAEIRMFGQPEENGGACMRRYIVERDIPKVGTLGPVQLCEAARTSNGALAQLGTDIQWIESFVADDKTFCVYLARHEALIRRHADISGFPASKITEITTMIDPTTARGL